VDEEALVLEVAGQLGEQETALDRLTEEAARLAARVTAAERRRDEARGAFRRIDEDIARAENAERALAGEIGRVRAALATAESAETEARAESAAVETALEVAEAARAAAQTAEAEARAGFSEIEGEITALNAEVQALQRLMAREAGAAEQILDRIEVVAGCEAALGAALGDDLRAAELEPGATASGWIGLPAYAASAALPDGAEALAAQVTGPGLLARRLGQVGVVAREQGDAMQAGLAPGQRLVSREGDLWRWDGYRVRAEDAPSSAALRLQRRNRLRVLTRTLNGVEARRGAAAEVHDAARAELEAASGKETALRNRRRLSDQALAGAARALSKAEAELEMHGARLETQRHSLELRRAERAESSKAMAEAEETVAGLEDVTLARAAVEAKRGDVDLARTAMLAARGRADEVRREGLTRDKRLADIGRERRGWQDRLEHAATRIGELQSRVAETATARAEAAGAPEELAGKRDTLAADIERAEARRRAAGDALAEGETRLRGVEAAEREAARAASECREARARSEARLEGAAERRDEAAARIREEMDLAPDQLLEAVGAGAQDLPTLDVVEILCQPPGKKLSTLSLLSGGEQTLTALSLIFAVFLSNPAPICVLDEVDAPLDDANVTRFCDLLDEMIRLTRTRFLIITHHAITMSRMDRLFGVTMVERGVSQLVSVDLHKAAELVDA